MNSDSLSGLKYYCKYKLLFICRPNCLFVRIPRCGSAAFTNLSFKYRILSVSGYDTGLYGKQPSVNPHINLCHRKYFPNFDRITSASRFYLGDQFYSNLLKFAIVRNPYARVLSIWNHKSWSCLTDFSEFLNRIANSDFPNSSAFWHSLPQSHHLFIDNKLAVDCYMRLEGYQLVSTVSLPSNLVRCIDSLKTTKIDNSKASENRKPLRLTDSDLDLLYSIYKDDFINLGYNPFDHSPLSYALP